MKPAFITGANAKIKMNEKIIAFAQDVSFNITTATIPVETIGRYEPITNEPVAYFVDGMLSIIRYTSAAKDMASANAAGNDLSKNSTNSNNPFQQINPSEILTSDTFDIEVFQKVSNSGTNSAANNLVAKIYNCRLTRLSGALNKRSILVEQMAFVGVLADESIDASGNPIVATSGLDDLKS